MYAWAYYGVRVETRGQRVLVLSFHHVSLDWNRAWWQVLLRINPPPQPCLVLRSHYIVQVGLQITAVAT